MSLKRIIGKISENLQIDDNFVIFKSGSELIRIIDLNEVKLKLGVSKFKNVIDYFSQSHLKFERKIFNEIKKSLLPQGMNPNKEYPTKYYYKAPEIYDKIVQWIFQTSSGEIENNHAILIGNKGSGKTVTQNCILHNYAEYFRENKIFWVRCDMQKLYTIWNHDAVNQKQSEYIGISSYLDAQLLYVFCKYYKVNKFFNELWLKLKEEGVTCKAANGSATELCLWISSTHEDILNYERNRVYKEPNISYIVEEILKNSFDSLKKKGYKKWIEYSVILQSFIANEKCKFLFILDGVDNIDLSRSDSFFYYKRMIDETKYFLQKDLSHGQIMYMTSMRPRTKNEIKYANTFPSHTSEMRTDEDFIEFELTIDNDVKLASIFYERFKYCIEESIKNMDQDNDKIVNSLSIIKKILDTIHLKEANSQTNLFFHENCRNYLFNKYNTLMFLFYRWLEDGGKIGYDFNAAYDKLKDQAILLNGRFYCSSEGNLAQNSDTGYYTFNIFYYSGKGYRTGQWMGLCCLRVIQYLEHNYTINPTIKQLKDYFISVFKYPENLLDLSLDLLREYGVIDSELTNTGDHLKSICLSLSRKGTIIYNKICCSLEWLYYFSLDTPLPNEFVNKYNLSSHDLKSFVATNYHFNCIYNGLLFAKYIKYVEAIEIDSLKRNIDFKDDVYDSTFKINFNSEKFGEFVYSSKENLTLDQKNLLKRQLKINLK